MDEAAETEEGSEMSRRVYKFRLGGMSRHDPVSGGPVNYWIDHCSYVLDAGLDAEGMPCVWYIHDEQCEPMIMRATWTGDDIPGTENKGEQFDFDHVGHIVKDGIVLHLWV